MASDVLVNLIFDVQNKAANAVKAFDKSIDGLKKNAEEMGRQFNDNFGIIKRGAQLTAGAMAALGVAVSAVAVKSVQAATVQEDAVNRLNSALKSTGDFTRDASLDLQRFAAEIEKVTIFGDELILNQLALAKAYGASNEQAKQIVTVATNMAAVFGTDLETQVRNTAKTLGGFAGELGESIPQLKELSQEALRSGAGIRLLAQEFSTGATQQAETFGGRIKQLSNSFGTFLENIGMVITQNKDVTKAFKDLRKFVDDLAKAVKTNEGLLKDLTGKGLASLVNGLKIATKGVLFLVEAFLIAKETIKFFGNLVFVAVTAPFQALEKVIHSTIDAINLMGSKLPGAFEPLEKPSLPVISAISEFGKIATEELGNVGTEIAKIVVAFDRLSEDTVKNSAKLFKEGEEFKTDALADALGEREKLEREAAKRQFDIFNAEAKRVEGIAKGLVNDIVGGYTSGDAGKAISGAAGAAAEFFLPGSGGVVSQITQFLGQNEQQLRSTVRAFTQGAVEFISNIIKNAPVIIEELVNQSPKFIDAFIQKIPDIISGFIRNLGPMFNALTLQMPRIAAALAREMPNVVQGLVDEMPRAVDEFIKGLVGGAPQFIEALISEIGDFGGAAGGVVSDIPIIGDVISGVGGAFGLRSVDTQVIQTQVDFKGEALADIMIELDRTGVRTSA